MLSVRVIPCLDVNKGRVVKGVNFVDLIDAGDPVLAAKAYEKQGADELVFLDITASSEGRAIMRDVVSRTADQCFMPVTVGGGLRSSEDIRAMLNAGADKVSLNTAAVQNPDLVSDTSSFFGNQCIVVAIDAKRRKDADGWTVYTHGGRNDTGRDAVEWAREVVRRGAGEILLTSMDRDGTKDGYDLELTRAVSEAVEVPVIASGGVGNLQHLADGILKGRASAVLAASIFHFGTYTIAQAKDFLASQGIPVRRVYGGLSPSFLLDIAERGAQPAVDADGGEGFAVLEPDGPEVEAVGLRDREGHDVLRSVEGEGALVHGRRQGIHRLLAVEEEHEPVAGVFIALFRDDGKEVQVLLRDGEVHFLLHLADRRLEGALADAHLQLAADTAPEAQVRALLALQEEQAALAVAQINQCADLVGNHGKEARPPAGNGVPGGPSMQA